MARPRNAQSSAQPAASATKTRQVLKEKTNTASPIYNDAQHLIKDAKPKRGRPRKAQQDSDELVIGGGLGQRDEAEDNIEVAVVTKPKRGRPKKVQPSPDELAISSAVSNHDDASAPPPSQVTDEFAKSDEVPPPTARATRRPPRAARKIVHNEGQNKVLEGLKQRMEATARGQKGKQATTLSVSDSAQPSSATLLPSKPAPSKPETANPERSEFSLSPSPPPPGKLSAVRGPRASIAQPGSVLRAQATPAIESSLLALKNFKRRPRQLSMLQMVQQRTASAAPSVAHTAIETTAVEDSSIFDLDLSNEEEDDFAPEAEGTPISKPSRKSSASTRGSVNSKPATTKPKRLSRKRKSDDDEDSFASTKSAKRRKPTVQKDDSAAPVTQVPATQQSAHDSEVLQGVGQSEIQIQDSFSLSMPLADPHSLIGQAEEQEDNALVPSTEPEAAADDDDQDEPDGGPNGTMAEPLSSSPPPLGVVNDDALADPLTQASPPPAKKPSKARTKPMLTATLQSLLPKRRRPLKPRHHKSEYDLESNESEGDAALDASHLDNDEDELGGRLRRQAKSAPKSTKKRGRPSKTATSISRKASAAIKRKSTTTKDNSLKTYSRQTAASDKENDAYESSGEEVEEEGDFTLPEISVSMEEAAMSKEIEDAKKKFAEVDEWDFEFESMSAENHRSSSPGWR